MFFINIVDVFFFHLTRPTISFIFHTQVGKGDSSKGDGRYARWLPELQQL